MDKLEIYIRCSTQWGKDGDQGRWKAVGAPGRGLAWSETREEMVPKEPLDRGCHVSLEGLGRR